MADAISRAGTIAVAWSANGVGRLSLDGKHWASVELSEKRQQWCIEDVEGRCLKHAASIRGKAKSKEEAVALAEAMIRDGRMPSSEEARAQAQERRRIEAEKRARRPSEQKRQAEREARDAAMKRRWELERRDEEAQPLWEFLAEAFDLSDPDLWRSNSFAAFKPRLILHLEAVIADLEWSKYAPDRDARLARAKEILAVLTVPSRLRAGD